MRIHLALALARGPASGAIAIAIAYRKTMVEAWKGGSAAPHDPPLDPPLHTPYQDGEPACVPIVLA